MKEGREYLRAVTSVRDPDTLEPVAPQHLGGGRHRCHFDNGALDFLIERYGVASMIDVGCGLGCVVEMARERGLEAWGIDGDPYCKPDVLHDFSTCGLNPEMRHDLVWSMEFLEHLGEEYLPNTIPVFRSGRVVMVTYAPPGKAGHHHVNCQPEKYWVEFFESIGFTFQPGRTEQLREASNSGTITAKGKFRRIKKPFIEQTGLIFTRDDGSRR